MPPDAPAQPWLSFLNDLDSEIDEVTELHCLGGFAVVHAYGLPRATADIDVISVVPYSSSLRLLEIAGKESALRRQHGIYLDLVTVASAPESYEGRLVALFPAAGSACAYLPLRRTTWLALATSMPSRFDNDTLTRCAPASLGANRGTTKP